MDLTMTRKEKLMEIRRTLLALEVLENQLSRGQDKEELYEQMAIKSMLLGSLGDDYYNSVVEEGNLNREIYGVN